jgi:hypothetical protein
MGYRIHDPGRILGRMKLPLVAVMILLAGIADVNALEITGRLNSSSYIFETFSDAQGEQEVEVDQLLRLGLDFKQLGHPDLSLSTLQTLRNHPPDASGVDLQLRSYRAVLHYRPDRPYSLSFGRQWVSAGVGSGLVDGLSLRWKRASLGRLTLFAGTRAFLNSVEDSFEGFDGDAFDTSGSWGFHYLSPSLPHGLNLSLSASRRFRDGREEDRRFGTQLNWAAREGSRLSYDARIDMARESLYYQRLILNQRVGEGRAQFSWTFREAPATDMQSDSWILNYFGDSSRLERWYLTTFDHSTQELRITMDRPCKLIEGWRVRVEILELFPEDEDRSDGFSLGLRKRNYSVGYRLQRGYGGDRDAFYGSYRRELGELGTVWLELNQVYFRYGDESLEETNVDDSALVSRLGFDRRFADRFDLRTAVELLNNPRADSEIRLLVRVGYRFNYDANE